MTEINLAGGGFMTFLTGIAWTAVSFASGVEWGYLVAGGLMTLGAIMFALGAPKTESESAPTAEDLE